MATSDGQEKTAPSLSLATRLPVPSLILVLATTIPLAYLARSIHFDGSPRPLLPQSERREATGIGPDLDGEDALVIGVFADDVFRHHFLHRLRAREASGVAYEALVDDVLDELADHLARHVDLERILDLASRRAR